MLEQSEQTALERQDLPCMYLADDESESIISIIGKLLHILKIRNNVFQSLAKPMANLSD